MPTAYPIYSQPLMAKLIMARVMDTNERPSDSPLPEPIKEFNFLRGVLPADLTYTNSSTTRYYWNSSGSLATAAANEPIFEYDPLTLALKGMRWEMEQRTNNVLYSSEDNAVWGFSNMEKSTGLSLFAGKSAIKGAKTGPSGSIIQTGIGTFSGSAECGWVIIEQGTSPVAEFTVHNSTSQAHVAYVRLTFSTGEVTKIAGGAITFGSKKLKDSGPNGGAVWLVWTSYTGTSGNTRRFNFYAAGWSGVDGQYSFLHHAQLEAGSYPSSPIITTSAAVIRQPDVLTASSLSWFNASEGTIVFEGIASMPATAQRGLYLFSDGTDNERLSGYRASGMNGGYLVVDGGVTQADVSTLGSIAQNATFRHAFAYKANDFAGVVNGGTVVADTSGTLPTVTQLLMGRGNTAGTQPFMGYARRFSYYPKRLPDAQLQGMSRV